MTCELATNNTVLWLTLLLVVDGDGDGTDGDGDVAADDGNDDDNNADDDDDDDDVDDAFVLPFTPCPIITSPSSSSLSSYTTATSAGLIKMWSTPCSSFA